MKKTLIGWLLDNKDVAYPGIYKPEGDGWIPCTITYSEDEWEEVEVVRWVVVNTSDKSECFTSHSEKMCEDWMKNVREPEKLNIVRLSNTYRRRKPEPEHNPIKEALETLSQAMKGDEGYAWAWQCNLAMMAVDAGATHQQANIRAADLMKGIFDIDFHPRLKEEFGYPKPEPEVWEGTTKRSVSGNVAIIHLSSEWIGKRVRVEVVE